MSILILAVGTLGFGRMGAPHAGGREGQVERNLKWPDWHERELGEESLVDREPVVVLQRHKDGNNVGEHWIELPAHA